MPGGLLQIAATGAQNEYVNGNPSMTHFRAVFRRHTNFAMEPYRMAFTSANLQFNQSSKRTFSCTVDRYAQLLSDCYFIMTLPDIWSPLVPLNGAQPPPNYDPRSTAIGYEFQWIQNIGYNLIDNISISANGVVLQTLRGEWLKFYSAMHHDPSKKQIVDQMVGNVVELKDPANAYDRQGQYPHAVTPAAMSSAPTTEPSIRSRQLFIPLHFWFCENDGLALPLTSMQNCEITINVTVRALQDLYTVVDTSALSITTLITQATADGVASITYKTTTPHGLAVGNMVTISGLVPSSFNAASVAVTSIVDPYQFTVASTIPAQVIQNQVGTLGTTSNPMYGKRIAPTTLYPLSKFLSPPTSSGAPSIPTLTTFFPNPYIEGNFIFLQEMEMNQLSRADQTYLVKTTTFVDNPGQYGGNSDLLLPFFNLVTRVVFYSQRSDRQLLNDWDNYTNWENPNRAPFASINVDGAISSVNNSYATQTFLYSSGTQQISSVYPRDPVVRAQLLFDGNERLKEMPNGFYSLIQMYRHTKGSPTTMPGVYMYSFALDNDNYQPSGAVNGSMFNKVLLRTVLLQPLPQSSINGVATTQQVCVLASTVFSQNPVVIPAANVNLTNPDGSLVYPMGSLLTIIRHVGSDGVVYTYTYDLGAYVESINFLRIVSGLASFVFAN